MQQDFLVAPYDAIHVGAAAPTLPQALVDQVSLDLYLVYSVTVLTRVLWVLAEQPRKDVYPCWDI